MKVFIWGIGGKMGQYLHFLLTNSKTDTLIGGFDVFANPEDFNVPVFSKIEDINTEADIIIDFSRSDAIDSILDYALKSKTNIVIATTGHTEEQIEKIKEASKHIAIFRSTNMSLGVNLLINLAKQAAGFLGTNFEVEIIEQHHNKKVDSPSGTALSIATEINKVYENKLELCYGRHSSNCKRGNAEIGIHAVRGGTIVGKHDVMYIGKDEVVTLSHEAQSRQVFAHGSIRAAQFLEDKQNGLYNMNDIIGSDYAVTNVSGLSEITLVTLNKITQDSLLSLLDKLSENKINIDMVSEVLSGNNYADISFTINDSNRDVAAKILENGKCTYSIESGLSKLSIEGAGMEHQWGVTSKILRSLSKINAKIWAITTSETKIACCVSNNILNQCIELLRKEFGVK